MPTVTQTIALDVRERLETLASKLGGGAFKAKLAKSNLDADDVETYSDMWDWCNKYMHPQPDGKHPNMVATAKAYKESLKGVHKFKPAGGGAAAQDSDDD